MPDIATFGSCALLGDFIKSNRNSPTQTIDGIENVTPSAIDTIVRTLPEKVSQTADNFRGHIRQGEENIFVQRAIINFDMFDSFMTALPSVHDLWKNRQGKSATYDEVALKHLQFVFHENIIKLHDHSGLTHDMVKRTLTNRSRANASQDGLWFPRSLSSRKG